MSEQRGKVTADQVTRREIRTARDADSIRADIETVHDGWFAEGDIDWDEFLDRLEGSELDLGDTMHTPAIRRIRAIVKELRSAS